MKLIKTLKPVDDRKGWLGGSSWGAALGLSTYNSPYDIAKAYLGERKEITAEQQEIFDMGHELEPVIASLASKKYGIKLKTTKYLYLSNRDNRLGCHPDRLVVGKIDGKTIGVEIKTSSAFDNGRWGEEDTDQIPYDYMIQCYSYFECVEVDEVWLIRFSNNKLTRYIIKKPKKEVLDSICKQLIVLMDNADKGVLPEPDTYKEMVNLYLEPKEGDINPTEDIEETINEWKDVKARKKEIEKTEDECKKRILKFLIDNKKSRIVSHDGAKLASYTVFEKTKFNKDGFKADYPDLFESYSYKSTESRLS